MTEPKDVLDFWYGTDARAPFANMKRWWAKDEAFDAEVRERFGSAISSAKDGGLENWKASPEGLLAFIILCDQFPRNAFRGKPESFASDELALETTLRGISSGADYSLSFARRYFFYMPLMHSEEFRYQDMSVQKFGVLAEAARPEEKQYLEAALDYAKRHRDIVAEFGRFPHRNAVLGRASTPVEVEFLKRPGSGF